METLQFFELFSQVAITILGVFSIVLIAKKNKWGFVFGLASQPFWFYTSYINEQWGIFLLSFVYLGSWIYGIYYWFLVDQTPATAVAK